jgi:hypothetical protein
MPIEEDLFDGPASADAVHLQAGSVDHLPDPAAGKVFHPRTAGLQHGYLRRPITKKAVRSRCGRSRPILPLKALEARRGRRPGTRSEIRRALLRLD